MATEESSPGKQEVLSSIPLNLTSESPTRKRPRRSKQDPQFIFDNPTVDDNAMDTTPSNGNKRTPIKKKTKPLVTVESADASADLYEPGDIVWCKLGGFPWWPALIVCRICFQQKKFNFIFLLFISIDVLLKAEYIQKH